MSRVKGAVLAAAIVTGFFLVSGMVSAATSTPSGVFALVTIMAALLLVAAWYANRR